MGRQARSHRGGVGVRGARRARGPGCIPGATSSCRAGSGWRTSTRATSPTRTRGPTPGTAPRPVAQYPPNAYGLYDVAGNVWEWASDWYRDDYYAELATAGVARNPQGPADVAGSQRAGVAKRVHRGGSFLCTEQYCSRYMVGTRGKGEPSTGTNHLGFQAGDAGNTLIWVTSADRPPFRPVPQD